MFSLRAWTAWMQSYILQFLGNKVELLIRVIERKTQPRHQPVNAVTRQI